MEIIMQYWHQVVFIVGLIIVAVRLSAQVKELRKDLDAIEKRDTYVETAPFEHSGTSPSSVLS